MKMDIELGNEKDVNALCSIFNEARNASNSFPLEPLSLADFLETIKGEKILAARVSGEIIGFASIWQQDIFLHHLYVSPQFQRSGVGRSLLQRCVEEFGLPMSLKCIKSNIDACRFYEKLGWQPKGEADDSDGRYVLYVREKSA